jgi:hypothetical protein
VTAWSRIRKRPLAIVLLLGAAVGFALLLAPSPLSAKGRMDAWATRYVELVLSLGNIDAKEVDGYFGPSGLDVRERLPRRSADELQSDAATLLAELESDRSQENASRRERLQGRVKRLLALLGIIKAPKSLSFDQEAQRVYGVDAGAPDDFRRRAAIQQLEALLPGDGTLASRVNSFRNAFVVPAEKRDRVFRRALAECRARTLAHWPLPGKERLDVIWSNDIAAAWHQYHGGYRSTLKLNPLSVALIGSAVDVACHEGYPGHHAQFLVMEADAGKIGPPIEDTIVLTRSSESVLREGAANYGVDLVFPLADRVAFERNVLFPLAGFSPELADKYVQVHHLVGELALSVMPILSRYRDGLIGADAAARALEEEALISSPRALLGFVDEFGAYAIGYTVARDRIRNHIEVRSGGNASHEWRLLRRIMSAVDVSVLSSRTPAEASHEFPSLRSARDRDHHPV